MEMALFTAENAVEMGRRSAELRKQRAIERDNPVPVPVEPPVENDQFASRLSSACDEALDKLIQNVRRDKTMQAAQLARALRDLRETWHMATGKPKPGMIKPGSERPTRTLMPRVYPTNGVPGTGTGQDQPK